MIWGPFKSLTRISSFTTKELVETIRRPAALLSLILGPFLIMALFGMGYSGVRRPLNTVIVVPPNSGLQTDLGYYQNVAGPAVHIVGIEPDAAGAEAQLRDQQIDLVVIAPADARAQINAGKQAHIRVEYNVEDPVLAGYVGVIGGQLQQEVNKQIVMTIVAEADKQAPASAPKVPPAVVAEPTVVDTHNVAPTAPTVIPFFGPAVFALILQHLAVTVTALSLVRERVTGAIEVFRVSPVDAFEMLIGKYLAFGLLNGVVAAIVAVSLVMVFGVPFLGSLYRFVAVVALLTFASLGVGFLISVVSSSERQTVQLSLLLLLASVFFSGFVLPVDEFVPAIRVVSYMLPVTHGIRLIQDIMLRGSTTAGWEAIVLAAIGIVCFLATLLLVRRSLGSH